MKSISNTTRLYLRDSILSIAIMFYSGNYVVMFLVQSGVTNAGIGVFNSIGSFVSLGSMLICGFIADRLKDIRKAITISFASLSLFYMVMIYFSFVRGEANTILITCIVVYSITSFIYGFRNVLDYKLVYLITDIRRYARLTAVTGLITGVVGIAAGFGISLIMNHAPYYPAMSGFFIMSLLLIIGVCCMNQSFTIENRQVDMADTRTGKDPDNGFLGVLRSRHFYVLAIPNLIRGIATGLMGLSLVIGIEDLAFNPTDSSILTTVGMAATFSGSLVYSYLSDKVSARSLCIVSAVIIMVALPLCIVNGKIWFFVLYFLAFAARHIVDGTIPVMVTQIVPYEQMGAYTSLRMMLMTGGSALASLIGAMLIGKVPSVILLTAAAALMLICVAVYYLYSGICLRKQE